MSQRRARRDSESVKYRSPGQVFPITTGLVLLIFVPLWIWVVGSHVRAPSPLLTANELLLGAALMVIIFIWCEVVPVRVEVRKETLMVSLSEFPLVIGLLILPWQYILLTQLVAGVGVYVVRRDGWRHSTLNVALIIAETGAALGIMIALGSILDTSATTIIPVALGVLTGAMASALIVGLAYRQLGPAEPLTRVLSRAAGAASFVIIFALVEHALWAATPDEPVGPLLALALVGGLVFIYLIFRSMMSRHSDLNQMYTFIRAVGVTQADNTRWPEMMEMVRAQNNATSAVLYMESGFEFQAAVVDHLFALAVDTDGQLEVPSILADDYLLQMAKSTGVVRVSVDRNASPAILQALEQRGATDVMIVALRTNDRVRGYVEVRDRLSRWGRFSEEDGEFLATLSGHMATALENVRLLSTLRNEAYRDSVTGLRSRAGLAVDAEAALAAGSLGSVVLVQLGTLSEVNNALGYSHGEELLVLAGQRILESSPIPRQIARLESDLFAILMEPMAEEALTEEVVSVLSSVSTAFSLVGVDVEAEPHAGIALVQGEAQNPDSVGLLQRAEMALLAGRNRHERYEIYRPTMGEMYRRRFQLVTQFRQAVESGHIVVYYQPKITLRNQELRGVEALVRWVHPEFGMVTPAEFVKAIEATGSIDILLNHVLDTVLKQIKIWTARGLQISVAVNLSVRNLTANFPERVAEALRTHDVPARLLMFELTESNVMNDPELALPVLDALQAQGIALSVDDFGTGYSSLAYLRRLPIEEIKIDRSFVQGMSTALGDLAIVQSIIDLGHSLGLQVVAEGVEEESSREALRSMRCDGMQGFLLSRPQPVDRFEAWLAARTVRSVQPGTSQPVLRVVG